MAERHMTKHQELILRTVHHDFDGHTIDEAANILNLTPRNIYAILKRIKEVAPQMFPILSRLNALIWHLYSVEGISYAEIAYQVNLTTRDVERHLERLKIQMNWCNERMGIRRESINMDTLEVETFGMDYGSGTGDDEKSISFVKPKDSNAHKSISTDEA